MVPVLTSTWRSTQIDLSLVRIEFFAAQDQFELYAAVLFSLLQFLVTLLNLIRNSEIFLLADREIDLDRVERGHRGQFAIGIDEITDLGLGNAHHSADRRRDPGPPKLSFACSADALAEAVLPFAAACA